MYRFKPDYWRTSGYIEERFSDREIEAEPMLYSASRHFAEAHGGPITQAVLRSMPVSAFCPDPGRYIVIDSRVHMLMPGMYPAIPGWHCDAWPRTDGGRGQPDPENKKDKEGVQHFVAMIGDCSRTEFMDETLVVNLDRERVWESVSRGIEDEGSFETFHQAPNMIISFGPDQLHRATPATKRGWRFWLRLSHYQRPPLNQIRKQVQVYVTEHGGW
jgi:hypothetical protein